MPTRIKRRLPTRWIEPVNATLYLTIWKLVRKMRGFYHDLAYPRADRWHPRSEPTFSCG